MKLVLLLIGLVLSASTVTADDTMTFERLSGALKPRPNEQLFFQEQRYLQYLKEPMELSGWMRFVPPKRFERHITAPITETFVIDEEQVSITDAEGHIKVLTISDHPALRSLTDGIRATLLGDLETLNARFDVSVNGTWEAWHLDLTPKESSAQKSMKLMTFSGTKDLFTDMIIVESNNDKTHTTFVSRGQ